MRERGALLGAGGDRRYETDANAVGGWCVAGMLAMGLSVYDYQDFLDRGWRRSGHWLYMVGTPPSHLTPPAPPLPHLLFFTLPPCPSPPRTRLLMHLASSYHRRAAVLTGR